MVATVFADASTAPHGTWLVFRLGPCVMCASALDVQGIIQCPEAIAKLPLTPDYALGAFLFRERSAAAISLRKKLKLREGEDRTTGPFIVARIRDAHVAFWVDEVEDVIDEADAEWRTMPSMLEGGVFERLGIRHGQIILQTSFAALRDANVEFESLAAQLRACTAVSLAPGASEARADEDRALRSESAEPSQERPGGAPVSVAARERKSEPDKPTSRPVGILPALPPRTRPTEPRPASPGRRAGRVPDAKLQSLKLGVRRDSRAAGSPPAQRSHGEQQASTLQVADNDATTLPVPTVPRPAEAASAPEVEKRAGAKRVPIAAAVTIIALAGILYALLPASPRQSTPTLPSAPFPSVEHTSAPAVLAAPEPSATPIIPAGPAPVVLALQAGPGMPERVHTYTVVRGDTLWQIAKRHVGDPFQYGQLAKLSDIRNPDLIHPGDLVRIEIRQPK